LPGSYECQDFAGLRHALGRLGRKQHLAIQMHFQGSWSADPYLRYGAEFAVNFFFQAHGLFFNIGSHEAALNLNFHRLKSSGKVFCLVYIGWMTSEAAEKMPVQLSKRAGFSRP